MESDEKCPQCGLSACEWSPSDVLRRRHRLDFMAPSDPVERAAYFEQRFRSAMDTLRTTDADRNQLKTRVVELEEFNTYLKAQLEAERRRVLAHESDIEQRDAEARLGADHVGGLAYYVDSATDTVAGWRVCALDDEGRRVTVIVDAADVLVVDAVDDGGSDE